MATEASAAEAGEVCTSTCGPDKTCVTLSEEVPDVGTKQLCSTPLIESNGKKTYEFKVDPERIAGKILHIQVELPGGEVREAVLVPDNSKESSVLPINKETTIYAYTNIQEAKNLIKSGEKPEEIRKKIEVPVQAPKVEDIRGAFEFALGEGLSDATWSEVFKGSRQSFGAFVKENLEKFKAATETKDYTEIRNLIFAGSSDSAKKIKTEILNLKDSDGDKVNDLSDCAPEDPKAFDYLTVYKDADGDGCADTDEAERVCVGRTKTWESGYTLSSKASCAATGNVAFPFNLRNSGGLTYRDFGSSPFSWSAITKPLRVGSLVSAQTYLKAAPGEIKLSLFDGSKEVRNIVPWTKTEELNKGFVVNGVSIKKAFLLNPEDFSAKLNVVFSFRPPGSAEGNAMGTSYIGYPLQMEDNRCLSGDGTLLPLQYKPGDGDISCGLRELEPGEPVGVLDGNLYVRLHIDDLGFYTTSNGLMYFKQGQTSNTLPASGVESFCSLAGPAGNNVNALFKVSYVQKWYSGGLAEWSNGLSSAWQHELYFNLIPREGSLPYGTSITIRCVNVPGNYTPYSILKEEFGNSPMGNSRLQIFSDQPISNEAREIFAAHSQRKRCAPGSLSGMKSSTVTFFEKETYLKGSTPLAENVGVYYGEDCQLQEPTSSPAGYKFKSITYLDGKDCTSPTAKHSTSLTTRLYTTASPVLPQTCMTVGQNVVDRCWDGVWEMGSRSGLVSSCSDGVGCLNPVGVHGAVTTDTRYTVSQAPKGATCAGYSQSFLRTCDNGSWKYQGSITSTYPSCSEPVYASCSFVSNGGVVRLNHGQEGNQYDYYRNAWCATPSGGYYRSYTVTVYRCNDGNLMTVKSGCY